MYTMAAILCSDFSYTSSFALRWKNAHILADVRSQVLKLGRHNEMKLLSSYMGFEQLKSAHYLPSYGRQSGSSDFVGQM